MRLSLRLAALLLAASACTQRGNLDAEPPTEPLAFRRFLMAEMPSTLQATECQCCKKSLLKCYEETLSQEGQRCPDS